MKKSDFVSVWDTMTESQKGAAVEEYFRKTHPGAEPVRSDYIDFKYNGEKIDVKSNKTSCPRLNKNQIKNGISILWYDWSSVCEINGVFPIKKISAIGGTVTETEWHLCCFSDFSRFVAEYKKNKGNLIKSEIGSDRPMSAKKLRDSWAEVNLHPIFNKRFGHGNRFLLWKDKTKGMKPALLNGKYDKFQRTIVIFYENTGTDTEPNLLVKKWWLFCHDKQVDKLKSIFDKHGVDEKFYATPKSFQDGYVIEFTDLPSAAENQ
jgi:hypothetical protein